MFSRLKLEENCDVGCGLLPPPSAAPDINPPAQEIGARRLPDKRGSQYFTEELLCFVKFLLRRKDARKALQIHQSFRALIPPLFARDGQRFAMHGFRFRPLAFCFERQTQLAQCKH